ncbi:hypothetical protein F3D3_2150 [Fusibacter sp. 3D3]|nr:hypothetical protein F3D3_2150 [Fusibacter sp. 3D3]
MKNKAKFYSQALFYDPLTISRSLSENTLLQEGKGLLLAKENKTILEILLGSFLRLKNRNIVTHYS